ncbi:MAG: YcxB family protein [Bacteroidota bacterium]
MDTKEIILNYHRKDFEEIYFSHGRDKVLFHQDVKKEFYTVIIVFSILIVLFIYYLSTGNNLQILVVTTILFFLASINLYKKASPLFKWKNQIHAYLNDLSKIKDHKIIIEPLSFSLVQDQQVFIEKWTEIKKVEITDNYILLQTNSNYLIPKNSMTLQEFDFLKNIVLEKIN